MLRNLTSNHYGDFYNLNYLHYKWPEEKCNSDEKACKYWSVSKIIMPDKENKVLKYSHGQKSSKIQFVTFVGFKAIL